MGALALKLVLTPALIGLATLAGRRWGQAVGGWLVGLPLTSGPVVFFLALGHGRSFAAAAAVGCLGGAAAEVGFCLVYRSVAPRGWPAALVAASLAYTAAAAVLRLLPLGAGLPVPLLPLAAAVLAALAAGLALLGTGRARDAEASIPSRWDVPGRMVAGTAVVVALTAAAPFLGPRLAGLLATYPLLTAVLTVAAQRLDGPASATEVLRGLLLGLHAFAAFFVVLAVLLERIGTGPAFAAAIAAALAIQALSLRFARASRGSRV